MLPLADSTRERSPMPRITAWGNSHGVRIPREVLDKAGIAPESEVTITAEAGRIVIEPARRKLLTGVRTVTFRFLDPSRSWVDRWPEAQAPDAASARSRPAAVEVVIELDDWGEVRRLLEVPG